MFRFILNKIKEFRWLTILAVLLIIGGAVCLYSFNGSTGAFSPAAKTTPAAQHKTVVNKPITPPTSSTPSSYNASAPVTTTKAPITAPQSAAVVSSTTPATGGSTSTTPPVTSGNPTPTPTPAPTFHIALQLDQSTTQVLTYPFAPANDPISQYITPFTITKDPGFTQINPATMGCEITEEPAGSNMLCLASEKEEGSGFLTAQCNNSTPLGRYTIQVDYTIDGVTKSDAMQFDLASN